MNSVELDTFDFANTSAPSVMHSVFRYPAKFHPPVAHALVDRYTRPEDLIFDPFCGSGTLPIAAAIEGRDSVGSDVDPLAVFIARTKLHRRQPARLNDSWLRLYEHLVLQKRSDIEHVELSKLDIEQGALEQQLRAESLWVPRIPNLYHWFRNYIILDLARMLRAIDATPMPSTHRAFFRFVFAAIIRKCSNADPVPVSGLEVTAHMKQLDINGRIIDPHELFVRAVGRALDRSSEYWRLSDPQVKTRIFHADARRLARFGPRPADVIITSPPYHNAVDYYRRHQLETYWLGFARDHGQRLQQLPKYIGRSQVRKSSPELGRVNELGPLGRAWYQEIYNSSPKRSDAFLHYLVAMSDCFRSISSVLAPRGRFVLVAGNSRWNEQTLPTTDLLIELLRFGYRAVEHEKYRVKNHHMSYSRRNGAAINEEHVIVLEGTLDDR